MPKNGIESNVDLINVVGPSNSNLISIETIIDRADFIGINNVPLNDKESS